MLRFLRKFAALTLLLVIPLQGIAAMASILKCPPVETAAAHSFNGEGAVDQERNGGAVKEFSAHLCCHSLFSGIPVASTGAAMADSSGLDPSILLPPSLFFPEQPQRPPLSARV